MIQEFSIKNSLSIKDKLTISFKPKVQYNKASSPYLLIDINEHTQLLKSAIIYGANASGKTNILASLEFFHGIITDSDAGKDEEIEYNPFCFDESAMSAPSCFEIIFFVKGIKYWYELELDSSGILLEKLYYYPNKKPSKVFLRGSGGISFGDSLSLSKYDKAVLGRNCYSSISLIAVMNKVNIDNQILNDMYYFFSNDFMNIITPRTDLQGWAINRLEKMNDNERHILLSILNKADFNLEDVVVRTEIHHIDEKIIRSMNDSDVPQSMIQDVIKKGTIESKTLEFLHKYQNTEKALNAVVESNGTRRYLGLSVVLEDLLLSSHFLAIDELEASLHPDLLLHFFLTFLLNSKNSQLIFSTHNQTLLESDSMRKDMLWFCEKDPEYGDTSVMRGSDYGIHKNNSIANFYKIGKLGAVPDLGSIQLFDLHGDCINE